MNCIFKEDQEISSYIQNIVSNITFSIPEQKKNSDLFEEKRKVFFMIDNINSFSNLTVFPSKRKNQNSDHNIENMFIAKKKIKSDILFSKNSKSDKENLYR